MKQILLMIAVVALVGCGENRAISEWKEEKEARAKAATNTNEVDGTTEKPVKELTLREKVLGTYAGKKDGNTHRMVLLENGTVEEYINGKKRAEYKLEIVNDEIHAAFGSEYKDIYRINTDRSITNIATITPDGKREDYSKISQHTYKKIK